MKKEFRIKKGTLPKYEGGKSSVMDAADGIDLLLVQNTNKVEYENFCSALKNDGYDVYVTRILNGNISILVSLVQPEKAYSPMLVTG